MDDTRNVENRNQDEFFAIIDEMRDAFRDVPSEEIERNAVAIVRHLREEDEVAMGREEHATAEPTP